MNNPENLEKEIEKRYKRREKRKRPKIKTSGRKIFKLKELFEKKRGDY